MNCIIFRKKDADSFDFLAQIKTVSWEVVLVYTWTHSWFMLFFLVHQSEGHFGWKVELFYPNFFVEIPCMLGLAIEC